MDTADPADAAEAIAGLPWWHRIEVAPGVTTPGAWDLAPMAARLPWPAARLDGLRCLDVGTMDGFWAFEMERRGAADVVAVDLLDPARQDGRATGGRRRRAGPTPPGHRRGRTFRVAADLLGSRAELRDLSVYDLDPGDVGRFDLVAMGYVLQMLRDPLRGLDAVRRVLRPGGHLLLLDTVSRPLSLIPAPVARLDARREGFEWFVFNRRGLAKVVALAGFDVRATTGILRDRYVLPPGQRASLRTRALHRLPLRGRSAAVRARPVTGREGGEDQDQEGQGRDGQGQDGQGDGRK